MIFSRPVTALIEQRYSCRTYLDRPIAADPRDRLADYAAALQVGPLDTRSRFELVTDKVGDSQDLKGLGTYGFIKGATGYIVGATVDEGNALEDFGYLMEQIILFATDLGLGTCWLGGSFNRSRFAKKISLTNDEIIPAVTSVGYISKKPRKVDQIIRREARAAERRPWNQLFFEGAFGVSLSEQVVGEWAIPLEMLRLAPSASNRQPWRIIRIGNALHFYLQRTPGYRENTYSKLLKIEDLQRVDMGIAMCHFELTAIELGLPGGWDINNPGLPVPDELTEYTVSWVE
jgi:nitroreductase